MGSICSTGCRLQISHLSYETVKSISDIIAYVLWLEKLKSEKIIITEYVFIEISWYTHYKLSWSYILLLFSPFYTNGKENSVTFKIQSRESSTGLSDFKVHVFFSPKSRLWEFSLRMEYGPFGMEKVWALIAGVSLLPNSRGIILLVVCVTVHIEYNVNGVTWHYTKSLPSFSSLPSRFLEAMKSHQRAFRTELEWSNLCFRNVVLRFRTAFQSKNAAPNESLMTNLHNKRKDSTIKPYTHLK